MSIELDNDEIRVKACCSCKESILEDARVCKHCGTNQKAIFSFLNLFVPYLSFAVALIALVVTMWPGILNLFGDKLAEVRYEIIKTENDRLTLFVANDGNRTTVIKGVSLFHEVTTDGKTINACQREYIPLAELVVLKPNDQKVVETGVYMNTPKLIETPRGGYKVPNEEANSDWMTKQFHLMMSDFSEKSGKYEGKCRLTLVTVAEKTEITPDELEFTCVPKAFISEYENISPVKNALTKQSR